MLLTLSCPVPILSFPVVNCLILSCPVFDLLNIFSCLNFYYHLLVLSCPNLSCPVLSNVVMSLSLHILVPVMSCPLPFCAFLSCSTLSCEIHITSLSALTFPVKLSYSFICPILSSCPVILSYSFPCPILSSYPVILSFNFMQSHLLIQTFPLILFSLTLS